MDISKYSEEEKLDILLCLAPVLDIPLNIKDLGLSTEDFINIPRVKKILDTLLKKMPAAQDLAMALNEESMGEVIQWKEVSLSHRDDNETQEALEEKKLSKFGISIDGRSLWIVADQHNRIPKVMVDLANLILERGMYDGM